MYRPLFRPTFEIVKQVILRSPERVKFLFHSVRIKGIQVSFNRRPLQANAAPMNERLSI